MNGCYGRTFRELFPQTKEMTLDTFLDQWSKGMFLSLRTDGRTQESVSQKMGTESWSGGCLTLNTSESPNDAVESSLYSVLEHGGGTRRYCLSPKACEGILRRAEERGKTLPVLLKETLMKMASVPNGGCDRKGIENQYVDQGNVVMEKQLMTYDMKQHHAPIESDTVQLTTGNCKGVRGDTPLVMDVISWKERDRLAPIMNNLTGTLAASDYKGTSFVGYMEKDNETLCVQMSNTGSNGSNIDYGVSATLAKNNTLAVAYKDEHDS